MSNIYKLCNSCGKELPLDSEFCQYCGSQDIVDVKEEKEITTKKCNVCGNSLPLDSEFCQYCGSKDIVELVVEKEARIEPDTYYNYLNNEEEKKIDNTKKNYKIPFIIVCIFSFVLTGMLVYTYIDSSNDINNLNSQIENLNKKVDETNKELSKSKTKSAKYDEAIKIANQKIYSDFRANSYVVKGTNSTINIFCNIPGSYTVSPTVTSGSGIGWEWGNWAGSGYNHYCPMYITCNSSSKGVITFTNSYNNHTFKVFVTGS